MIRSFRSDLVKSWHMLGIAFYFAWGDTRARYSRSFLGPFWIVLATLVGVIGLGIVWSNIFKDTLQSVLPSLTLGLVFWYFISNCITEAPMVFITNAPAIKDYPNPYLFFIFKHLIKHFILLAHNLVIVVAMCFYYHLFGALSAYALFFLGLTIVFINLFWISAVLAILSARFRDLEMIISAIMPIAFFLTPVIFKPQQAAGLKTLMIFNPFANFIRIVRDPLFSGDMNMHVLFANLALIGLGLVVTPLIYRKMIQEVPYLL